MIMLAVAAAVVGCSMFRAVGVGAPITNQRIEVREGQSFGSIVSNAATRRGWQVTEVGENTWECAIYQRSNVCVVKVVYAPETKTFSILPVESNITVAKYNQWVNKLRNTIIATAAK